jgi:hypothetical protein
MDIFHPAQQQDIRHFGCLAKRIQRLPPPAPLSRSFSSTVELGMANHGPYHPMKRRHEEWRQEGWMEEDDLLQEDFKREQDLRRQLQKGQRSQEEGSKGRKPEGVGMRSMAVGFHDLDKAFSGKGARGQK